MAGKFGIRNTLPAGDVRFTGPSDALNGLTTKFPVLTKRVFRDGVTNVGVATSEVGKRISFTSSPVLNWIEKRIYHFNRKMNLII